MKNTIIGFVAIILVLIGGLVYWGLQDSGSTLEVTPDDGASIVYYYGAECPHCKDVQDFIDQNGIAEKVHFVKKEVWHNTKNASEMEARAKTCGIQPEGMGVPFVFADGKCMIGTPSAIDFFKKSAGIE